VLFTSLGNDIPFESLCAEMRDICKFDEEQPFTIKWLDEEGLLLIIIIITRDLG